MATARNVVTGMGASEQVSIVPRTLADWFLTVTRLAIGYMWFNQTMWKVPPQFGCPANFAFTTDINNPTSGLCDWIGRQATYGEIGAYKAFLTGFIMPNIQWVGWLVYLAELGIAISLIFGVLTRLGGLAGAGMGLNLLIGFIGVPHEWPWTYIFLILINLLFVVFPAGRKLGVDHFLRQRFADARSLVGSVVRLTT